MKYRIKNEEIIKIKLSETRYTYANQLWYKDKWKMQAGCGPTNASQLVWYLSKSNSSYASLLKNLNTSKEDFVELMNKIWDYITPTYLGVNNVDIFKEGLKKYFIDNGLELEVVSLDLRKKGLNNKSFEHINRFMIDRLSNDNLVAFLTLSKGKENKLYNWHWTTIVEYDSISNEAIIIDANRKFNINIKNWYETSLLGGGLVAIDKNE